MAIKSIDESILHNIGDAIRSKTGKIELFQPTEMAIEILSIEGGIDTSDATAQADDILQGETAYVDGEKITGSFTIDSELTTQDDLISQIQAAVDSLPEAGGDPVLQNKTVTPSASAQTVTADSGYDGLSSVVVNGDGNLVAENIAEGVDIFGVTGTHSGGSGGSVETCTFTMSIISPAIEGHIYYVDGNMELQSVTLSAFGSTTVTIQKNSLLCITTGVMASSDNLTKVNNTVFYISGDATAEY